jgi:hypothetical protein
LNLPKRRSIWSRRHKHEKQQKFAIKAKEAFETLKDRLEKAESTQKASMVAESQNKCLAEDINYYFEQILEREASKLERVEADLTSLLRKEERDNDSNRAIAAALRSDASSHAATVARLEGSVSHLEEEVRSVTKALDDAKREMVGMQSPRPRDALVREYSEEVGEMEGKSTAMEGERMELEIKLRERDEMYVVVTSKLDATDVERDKVTARLVMLLEQTAALHAEELARVRLESEALASHAVEKKLQEMSTLHSAALNKLREEQQFVSSEEVQRIQAAAEEQRVADAQRVTNELNELLRAELEKAKSEMLTMVNSSQSEQLEQLVASHREELARVRSELEASVVQAVEQKTDELHQLQSSASEEMQRLWAAAKAKGVAEIGRIVSEMNDAHAAELEKVKSCMLVSANSSQARRRTRKGRRRRVSGELLLNTGATVGDSGAVDIESGLSASGLGGSIAIIAGSGTDIGGAVRMTAGDSSRAAGGDVSIAKGFVAGVAMLERYAGSEEKLCLICAEQRGIMEAIGDSQLCFLRCDDISDEDSTMCLLDGGDR